MNLRNNLRMSARLLLFGCWLAGLLAAGPVRAQLPGAQPALDSVRLKYRLPALLAAVIEPGSIHYVYGGVRRRDKAEPVALTDYFHIGSNTKAVTSLLAARLVEKGKIQWDSKLIDVVPVLRGHVSAAFAGVTLEQLLAHRAGLPPYTSEQEYTHLPALVGTVSEKRLRFAQVILREPPVTPAPGQAYVYSNADYVLAALMLEQVTQRSWEELVAQAFHKLRLRYVLSFPNRGLAQQP